MISREQATERLEYIVKRVEDLRAMHSSISKAMKRVAAKTPETTEQAVLQEEYLNRCVQTADKIKARVDSLVEEARLYGSWFAGK